jgi:DNA-binding NtrC family response regulator
MDTLQPSLSTHQAHILIIDDDPALLESLADALRIRLFRVVIATASNGSEALQRARNDRYDIILCDVSMPDINGLALLPQLKNITPNSAVIMMTGDGEESIRRAAAHLGALESINKPFDRLTLVRILKQVLQAQHQKSR